MADLEMGFRSTVPDVHLLVMLQNISHIADRRALCHRESLDSRRALDQLTGGNQQEIDFCLYVTESVAVIRAVLGLVRCLIYDDPQPVYGSKVTFELQQNGSRPSSGGL
jgi:hypothetical protein